jgi:deoxyribose-phosphate aldolase
MKHSDLLNRARALAHEWTDTELCHRCLDATSLGVADSEKSVGEWARGISELALPPAAVCVWPNFVDTVGLTLGDSPIRIASVVGGFPAGQTYLEVKMLEAAMAVENGADEVDMVMNIGAFLSGEDAAVAGEIELLRREVGEDVTLKVIIESGLLPSQDDVRRASLLVASAGADFVKTSTGRATPAATPESAVTICESLRDYAAQTGRRVGFKAAGGIRTMEDAALYAAIVRLVLGDEWLTPALFRIGLSRVLAESDY